MTLLPRWTSAIACVFLTTAALDAGGWAVITVVRTPDTVVAGEPITVTYAARQHGQTLLNGLRGQIEARSGDMADALALGGASKAAAAKEIAATVDRLIYYAGWADKYEQVLGNVNPVASPHFNFTVTEPMGIIGVLAPDEAPLLALVSLIAPAITSGNTVPL